MKVTITIDDEARPAAPGCSSIRVSVDPDRKTIEQARDSPAELTPWAHMIALVALDAIANSMRQIGVRFY